MLAVASNIATTRAGEPLATRRNSIECWSSVERCQKFDLEWRPIFVGTACRAKRYWLP
jgi:hypothetical protein